MAVKNYTGEAFLNKRYKNLVNSDIVKHTAIGRDKNEDVQIYMERLNRITKRAVETNNLGLLKSMYYKKYVIKPENITRPVRKLQISSFKIINSTYKCHI